MGRQDYMARGPEGLRGHPLTSVGSICASAAAIEPSAGTRGVQGRRPERVPTAQQTPLHRLVYTRPCLCAGRGGSLFPRIPAPRPRVCSRLRNTDSEKKPRRSQCECHEDAAGSRPLHGIPVLRCHWPRATTARRRACWVIWLPQLRLAPWRAAKLFQE